MKKDVLVVRKLKEVLALSTNKEKESLIAFFDGMILKKQLEAQLADKNSLK